MTDSTPSKLLSQYFHYFPNAFQPSFWIFRIFTCYCLKAKKVVKVYKALN